MRVTLIHNPGAGDDDHSADTLSRLLREAGYDPAYCSSRIGDVPAALRDPGELVVVAGGDGTVRKVAPHLAGRGIPIGLLPLGTANNVATSLGIRGDVGELIRGWRGAARVPFDLGTARGPWGELPVVESVGLGVLAELMSLEAAEHVQSVEEARLLLRRVAADYRPAEWRIELDGRDLSGRYILVEAMNLRCVGPNLCLAPDARPDDGAIELVLLGETERAALLDLVEAPPKAAAPLPVHRGRRLALTCAPAQLHVDDEPSPEPLARLATVPLELTLERAALQFLVPERPA